MYYFSCFTIILLDQLSKGLIVKYLEHPVEVVPGLFNLVFLTNRGAAFSFLADVDSPLRHYFFITISIVALIGLTLLQRNLKNENRWFTLCCGLIAGGAAGNFIDRLRLGHVIDFLDVYIKNYHWPAFNVADSAICAGVALFFVLTFLGNKETVNKEEKG